MKKNKSINKEHISKKSFEIVVISILVGILSGILLLFFGANIEKAIVINFIQLLLIAVILGLVVDIRSKLTKKENSKK